MALLGPLVSYGGGIWCLAASHFSLLEAVRILTQHHGLFVSTTILTWYLDKVI